MYPDMEEISHPFLRHYQLSLRVIRLNGPSVVDRDSILVSLLGVGAHFCRTLIGFIQVNDQLLDSSSGQQNNDNIFMNHDISNFYHFLAVARPLPQRFWEGSFQRMCFRLGLNAVE